MTAKRHMYDRAIEWIVLNTAEDYDRDMLIALVAETFDRRLDIVQKAIATLQCVYDLHCSELATTPPSTSGA